MANILVVDDEPIIKSGIARIVKRVMPEAAVYTCESAEEAYQLLQERSCEIVFCDIALPGTNGVKLAAQILDIAPGTNIIFTTAYPEYTQDAMEMHASGYILKPVTEEKVRTELQDLRYPLYANKSGKDPAGEKTAGASERMEGIPEPDSAGSETRPKFKRIYLRTFGNFEVFCDGKPLQFKYAKTKEMLAYLTDRCGAMVDSHEVQAVLWENSTGHDSYYKQLRKDLFDTLSQVKCRDIIVSKRGAFGVLPDEVSCDYYEYLRGEHSNISPFNGEYMRQYSWAESTLASLLQRTKPADE
ncbi:MAG: response regulator [Eubacterium sp.]|nr:response regulator [Eubacterium sp.]